MNRIRSVVRGEGHMKFIVSLIGVFAVFFVGYKFIPVKVQHSKLVDCTVEEMKFAGAGRRSKDTIRDNIYDCAVHKAGLEDFIQKSDIKVLKRSSEVRVKFYYERDVELPGYTYTWKFDFDQKRALY